MPLEHYIDHTPFISPKFDANAYANAVLAGETYEPDSIPPETDQISSSSAVTGKGKEKASGNAQTGLSVRGDVGIALAKLNHGIEDVTAQLGREITQNHPLLLDHLSTTSTLSTSLSSISLSLSSLSTSLTRLQTKIHDPYIQIQSQVERLEKVRSCSEVLKRLARVVMLVRRLNGHMRIINGNGNGLGINGYGGDNGDDTLSNSGTPRKNGKGLNLGKMEQVDEGTEKEREMVKAALTLAELDSLLNPPSSSSTETAQPSSLNTSEGNPQVTIIPLRSLDIIEQYLPVITKSRETVILEMENMVVQGLANLNQPLLSTSLQTAYNLRLLPQLVSNLVADLNDAVEARIGKVFDVASIGREVASREQQNSTSNTASNLLYRARNRTADITPNNSNVSLWNQIFWLRFELLIDDIANCCIKVYTLEKVLKLKKDMSRQVGFLDEAMKVLPERPSFTYWTTLATAFDAKAREATNAQSFIFQALSSGYPKLLRSFHDFFAKISVHTDTVYTQSHQSAETVLILRSVSKFETAYLTRSSGRMSEAVNGAFYGGAKQPPSAGDGVAISRIYINELDSARFDPLLSRSVANAVAKSIEMVTGKVAALLVKDFAWTSLIGPQASHGQILNTSLISCLFHLTSALSSGMIDLPPKTRETLQTAIDAAVLTYQRPIDSLTVVIKRELSTIIGRIHRVDFSKPVDVMSQMGGSSSPYVGDLADKLGFLRLEILGRMNLGEMGKKWVLALTKYAISTFILNASIARPLGETGKLKLTSDMTQLEFTLGTFLSTGSTPGARNVMKLEQTGDEYKALRAFRTMLFLDPSSFTDPSETIGIQPLIVLHHIIVLSPLQLPHQIHNWTEAEYILWVDKHSEAECWALLAQAVAGQRGGEGATEWRELIKTVLRNAYEAQKDKE